MKYLILILMAGLSLFIFSCSEDVEGVDLLYVRGLVVRAQITAGDTVRQLMIYSNQPPLNGSDNFVIINDADAKIICEGREYVLRQVKGTYFYSAESLVPQVGKTYELQVRWEGLYAYATTTIPPAPVIDSIFGELSVKTYSYGDSSLVLSLKASLRPRPEINYLGFDLTYYFFHDSIYPAVSYIQQLFRSTDASDDGSVAIPMIEYYVSPYDLPDRSKWKEYFNFIFQDHYFGVEAFDKAFYEYYTTRWQSSQSSSPFGSSGTNTHWNVKGDGVGMFIGTAKTFQKVKL